MCTNFVGAQSSAVGVHMSQPGPQVPNVTQINTVYGMGHVSYPCHVTSRENLELVVINTITNMFFFILESSLQIQLQFWSYNYMLNQQIVQLSNLKCFISVMFQICGNFFVAIYYQQFELFQTNPECFKHSKQSEMFDDQFLGV